MRSGILKVIVAGLLVASGGIAGAAETITYTYDAKGRLTVACHVMGNAAQLNQYTLDRADNRTNIASASTVRDLTAGQSISSLNGSFTLTMQSDGNLVLLAPGAVPLWSSGTNGTAASLMKFQTDGNLVLYTSSGTPVWATYAYGSCATLTVQNDGNLVIRDVTGAIIWQTNTGGH